MKVHEVEKYAELMDKWSLTLLTVTEEGLAIRMERGRAPSFAAPSPQADAPAEKAEMTQALSLLRAAETGTEAVCSPMVGVFYAAPAENAEPFVSVGDRVTKGQTLCIVEAMKLMNEIRAERDGVIEKICVTNGQVVEYGTELFRILPASPERRTE